jgi:hypothetical protein
MHRLRLQKNDQIRQLLEHRRGSTPGGSRAVDGAVAQHSLWCVVSQSGVESEVGDEVGGLGS